MLHGLHVLLEVGHPGLRLEHRVLHGGRSLLKVAIELLVVHQSSYGSLPAIDLGADRIQIRRRPRGVLDGLLAAIEKAARLLEKVRHFERRLAGDDIAIAHIGFPSGSKRDRQILVAQQALGFDGGHGVLLDDLVRGLAHVHDYRDLFARLVGQHDAAHSSTVDPAHPHIGARIQAHHIVELRFQLVGRAEKILLAPDDEDAGDQYCQCHNDESSQPRRSRHISPYEYLRNSLTNSTSLF